MGNQVITTGQLMEQTGIRSSKTLWTWVDRGLLPKPEVGRVPSGHGQSSLWPPWTVDLVRRIQEMRKAGINLNGIRAIFDDEERTMMAVASSEEDIARAEADAMSQQETAVARFVTAAVARVFSLTGNRELCRQLQRRLPAENVPNQAVRKVSEGFAPLLVCNDATVRIIPDVALASFFHAFATGDSAFLVIPVADLARNVVEDLEEGPFVCPHGETSTRQWVVPSDEVAVLDKTGSVIERLPFHWAGRQIEIDFSRSTASRTAAGAENNDKERR